MSRIKDFIKRNPLLYPCAKYIKNALFSHQKNTVSLKKLDRKISHFHSLGIESHSFDKRVVISLTSFPARIYQVKYTVYSLLRQTYKPDQVILWLGIEKFPNKEGDLPKDLLKLKENGLTIRFVKDLKSFTKLIPALQEIPNSLIVTVDDDIYYPNFLLEKLIESHEKYPDCIIAHRVHRIRLVNGEIAPYKSWDFAIDYQIDCPTYLNFFTGVGGVLYDPRFLYRDILRDDLFMKLCPNADDVWFNAMATLQGTKTKIVSGGAYPLRYINPEAELSGENTLGKFNVSNGGNDAQIMNVLSKYPELLDKLQYETINGLYKEK